MKFKEVFKIFRRKIIKVLDIIFYSAKLINIINFIEEMYKSASTSQF